MKRALLVLAATTLAVGGPTFADAATTHKTKQKKKNHAITLTVAIAGISPGGPPPLTGRQVYAGTSDGQVGGRSFTGAVRGTNNYTGATFQGTATTFGPRGSSNATLTGTGKLNPDGTSSFTGSGNFVGGTGTYKGAGGTFTFTGTAPKPSATGGFVATFTISGNLKY